MAQRAQDPHRFLSPLAAAIALAVPAAAAVVSHQLLLVASLGPTAVMQAHEPRHRSSRFYAVVVSHLCGFAAASAVVTALGLARAPSIFEAHAVGWPRAVAAVISLALATWLEIAMHAPHPPAGSTTLLVALGSIKPTLPWLAQLGGGVLLVACAGEIIRRLRLRHGGTLPGPHR